MPSDTEYLDREEQANGLLARKYGRGSPVSSATFSGSFLEGATIVEEVSESQFAAQLRARDADIAKLQSVLEEERVTLRQVMSTAREAVTALEEDKGELEGLLQQRDSEAVALRERMARMQQQLVSLESQQGYGGNSFSSSSTLEVKRISRESGLRQTNNILNVKKYVLKLRGFLEWKGWTYASTSLTAKDSETFMIRMEKDDKARELREARVEIDLLKSTHQTLRIQLESSGGGEEIEVLRRQAAEVENLRRELSYREADMDTLQRERKTLKNELNERGAERESLAMEISRLKAENTSMSADRGLGSMDTQRVLHIIAQWDYDGDGKLQASEIASTDRHGHLFKKVDVDHDGCCTAAEFIQYLEGMDPAKRGRFLAHLENSAPHTKAQEDCLLGIFNRLDFDCDGKLTAAELREVDKHGRLFSAQDADHSGMVDANEWLRWNLQMLRKKGRVEARRYMLWLDREVPAKRAAPANADYINASMTTSFIDPTGRRVALENDEALQIKAERLEHGNKFWVDLCTPQLPTGATDIAVALEIAEVRQPFYYAKVDVMRNQSPPRSRSHRSGKGNSPRGKTAPRQRRDTDEGVQGMESVLAASGMIAGSKFEDMDANGDGFISREEWNAAAAAPAIEIEVIPPVEEVVVEETVEEGGNFLEEVAEAVVEAVEEVEVVQKEVVEEVAEEATRGPEYVTKSGWLYKKGGGFGEGGRSSSPRSVTRRSWKRRWFVLDGPVLKYFSGVTNPGASVDTLKGKDMGWQGDLRTAKTNPDGSLAISSTIEQGSNNRHMLEIHFRDRTLKIGTSPDTPSAEGLAVMKMWAGALREHHAHYIQSK